MDLNELVRDVVRDEMKVIIRAEVKAILAEALAAFDRKPEQEPAAEGEPPTLPAGKTKTAFTGKLTPAAITGIRVGLALNKSQFAFLVHCHPTAVGNWEKGINRPADKQTKRIREVSAYTEKEAQTVIAVRRGQGEK